MTDRPSAFPVACTLTPADLAARRGGLLPALASRATASTAIPGGRSWPVTLEATGTEGTAPFLEELLA